MLYNEGNVDARINRKLTALDNYFRDPSSSGGKWINLNDVIVYGGINTGVKFSVYLEYFILCQEQRRKVVPPFYQLLLSQILPYLDKLEVEHFNPLTPTGSSFAGKFVKVHQSVDDTPDTEEEEGDLLQFIQTTAKAYRHSATNARTLGEYMYISAFDLRSDEQFASVHEKIKENVTSFITRMRDLVQYEKALGIYSYQK